MAFLILTVMALNFSDKKWRATFTSYRQLTHSVKQKNHKSFVHVSNIQIHKRHINAAYYNLTTKKRCETVVLFYIFLRARMSVWSACMYSRAQTCTCVCVRVFRCTRPHTCRAKNDRFVHEAFMNMKLLMENSVCLNVFIKTRELSIKKLM